MPRIRTRLPALSLTCLLPPAMLRSFAKDQFKEYMDAEAVKRGITQLTTNKGKVVLAPASSAYKHALKEVSCSVAARACSARSCLHSCQGSPFCHLFTVITIVCTCCWVLEFQELGGLFIHT